MRPIKKLNFSKLRQTFSDRVQEINDARQEGKVKHPLNDSCLSALAMMYFQDPSMLEFQRRLQEITQRNNLHTMFDISSIPKDNQMRDIIDDIAYERFFPIFSDFFRLLQRGKHLANYRVLNEYYLIPIDGTQYFSSDKICCPSCLRKVHGKTTKYEHQALCAALVHPDRRQVFPLAPEPIKNEDGTIKQDCELNAGKRLIERIRKVHPKLRIIITADDLYSKQPFVELLRKKGLSFILVAKSTSHVVLFDEIIRKEEQNQINRLEFKDAKGADHIYEWINALPLNGNSDAPLVNFFEYSIVRDEDKITYHNSWVTDIQVNADNVKELVKAGRAKWKIENENFNTLKNQGYHANHNFGHGKKNLSFNFFQFILLAFFMHQIIELKDPLYQKARAKFSARKEFWNQLRCTIRFLVFENWEALLLFIISPPNDFKPP